MPQAAGTSGAHGSTLGMRLSGRGDDAADRLRAVTQGRRTADHLDLPGRQRIDRHEMIFAQIRHAAAADAVVDDADAVDVEAADDRTARRAGRKARPGDAGLGEQDVAQRRAGTALQFLARHHRDGRELIGDDRQRALQRRLRRAGLQVCGAAASGLGGRTRRGAPDRAGRRENDIRKLHRLLRMRLRARPDRRATTDTPATNQRAVRISATPLSC